MYMLKLFNWITLNICNPTCFENYICNAVQTTVTTEASIVDGKCNCSSRKSFI